MVSYKYQYPCIYLYIYYYYYYFIRTQKCWWWLYEFSIATIIIIIIILIIRPVTINMSTATKQWIIGAVFLYWYCSLCASGDQSSVDNILYCLLLFASLLNTFLNWMLCVQLGKIKDAFRDINFAILLEPNLVDAYWHRHLLNVQLNRLHQAVEDLNKVIHLKKSHVSALKSRWTIPPSLWCNQ